MSDDFPEAGNTLLPLSVTRGTPSSSKNSFVSAEEKDHTAPRRNFSPCTTPSRNSAGGRSAVRLHLPLPVMNSFLPVFSFFSSSVTSAPPSAHRARRAASDDGDFHIFHPFSLTLATLPSSVQRTRTGVTVIYPRSNILQSVSSLSAA